MLLKTKRIYIQNKRMVIMLVEKMLRHKKLRNQMPKTKTNSTKTPYLMRDLAIIKYIKERIRRIKLINTDQKNNIRKKNSNPMTKKLTKRTNPMAKFDDHEPLAIFLNYYIISEKQTL